MSEIRDTLFRYLAMLQLIPRSPGHVSTPVLMEKLNERGFQIDARSLQRDLLDKLAVHFPLGCDDSQRPFRWFFDREFHCNLPALDVPSALTLALAEEHLIQSAVLSESPWRRAEAFDIDAYIPHGGFGYLQGQEPIRLVVHVAPQVAWLLSETPLSETQLLAPLPQSDWQRLEARVPDNQQTLWWLMGLGAHVEVIEPAAWRSEIYSTAKAIVEQGEHAND